LFIPYSASWASFEEKQGHGGNLCPWILAACSYVLEWPTLMLRRQHHRLSIMFKIQNGLSPFYLTAACPPLTRDRTPYDLRSGMNITVPPTKTTTYQRSYFPASVKNWNGLNQKVREIKTIDTFKDYLKKDSGYVTNKLYHKFSNKSAINHTRIRLGLSGLGSQRHDYNHIDNPRCLKCNAPMEDPLHFFLICPHFASYVPYVTSFIQTT
jgi:hypothetical protein